VAAWAATPKMPAALARRKWEINQTRLASVIPDRSP